MWLALAENTNGRLVTVNTKEKDFDRANKVMEDAVERGYFSKYYTVLDKVTLDLLSATEPEELP